MKRITEKVAIDISNLYSHSLLTMADIADMYNKNLNTKEFSPKSVSRCIYYCIFHSLITQNVEDAISKKISANISRHLIYQVNKNLEPEKYAKVRSDRHRLCALKAELASLGDMLNNYNHLKALLHELEFASSLDIESYISSDDEREYVPPRSKEEIQADISEVKELISGYNANYSQVLAAKSQTEAQINSLVQKYSL